MSRGIFFGLVYALLKFFSLFPIRVLNGVGYLIFLLLNRVLHYRKDVILGNLRNSFPEKSAKEIEDIKTNFYRYFSRLLVENVKMFHLPLEKLEKYIHLENPGIMRDYFNSGKNVAVLAAHYGNWEWLLGLRKDIFHHPLGIYKTLNNKYFDKFFVHHRSQYGTEMVNMREVPRVLMHNKENKRLSLTVFIADQSPVWEEIQYWTNFLNQETPVYLGAEKLARKLDMAVVYFRMKVKPGNHYSVEVIPLADNASEWKEYTITERYLSLLEEDIRNAPEYWLWSHRRWKLSEKRKREENQGTFRFKGKFRRK